MPLLLPVHTSISLAIGKQRHRKQRKARNEKEGQKGGQEKAYLTALWALDLKRIEKYIAPKDPEALKEMKTQQVFYAFHTHARFLRAFFLNDVKSALYKASEHNKIAISIRFHEQDVTKEIGKNIESIAAYKAVLQVGDKIKMTDIKSRGKNKLAEIRKKIRDEEAKKKKRYQPIKTEEKLGDEFDADLLW